jgi:hypothetical protein
MTAPPVISLPSEPHQVAQSLGPLASYLRDHLHANLSESTDLPTCEETVGADQEPGRSRRREVRRTRECAGTKRRSRKPRGRQANRPNPAQKSREPQRRPRDRSTGVSSPDTAANSDTFGLRCIRCGAVIQYPNEHRCEDCFAEDVDRWPGNDQSAVLNM